MNPEPSIPFQTDTCGCRCGSMCRSAAAALALRRCRARSALPPPPLPSEMAAGSYGASTASSACITTPGDSRHPAEEVLMQHRGSLHLTPAHGTESGVHVVLGCSGCWQIMALPARRGPPISTPADAHLGSALLCRCFSLRRRRGTGGGRGRLCRSSAAPLQHSRH